MERKILLDIHIQTTEAVKASAALQQSIDKLKVQQKDLAKALKDGAVSVEQYNIELVKNKAEVSFLSDEQRKLTREIKNSNKAANEAEGSYNQLSAQYSLLKDRLNAMSLAERKGTEEGIKLEQQSNDIYEQMKLLQEATGKTSLNVGNYEQAIRNVLGENTEFSNTIQGMQDKLKALQELMKGADVGSQAFKDANDEAGKLRVQIDQALGKVDEFGDREPKNPLKKAYEDAFEAATGLTSALELINLTQSENENVAELQAKATKAVAIAQNLQNIARAKGAIIETAANIRTKALTAAQAAYTAVVGTSTGVMKAFRIALAATGVGALVIGLGLLITNFDKVRAVVLKFIPGLENVGQKVMGIVNAVTDFIGITSEAERKADAIAKKSASALDKQIKQLREDIEVNSDKFDKYTLDKKKAQLDALESQKDIAADEAKTEKEKNEEIAFQNRKLAAENRKIDAEKVADEKEKNKKIAEETKANNKKIAEENKRKNEELKQQQIDFNNQISDLQNQIAEGNIKAIKDENARKLAEIDKFEKDQLAALENTRKETEKLGKLSLDDVKLFETRKTQIENQAIIDRQALAKEIQTQNTEAEKKRIEDEANTFAGKVLALNKERENNLKFAELEISDEKKLAAEKLNIQLEYQQKVLELLKTQYAEANDEQKAALNQQISNVAGVISNIQEQIKSATEEGKINSVSQLLGTDPKQMEAAKSALQEIQSAFGQLNEVINAGFQVRQNEIASQYQAEEEAIKNSTASEKVKEKKLEELRKKRAIEEYNIAKEQFAFQQASGIANAIINGAIAAVTAWTTPDPTGGILTGIKLGLIAATTAASIATIASQPPPPKPQFYDGGFTEMSGNPRAKSNKSNSQRDVHHNEYIVPWKVLKQGDALPHIAALESMRKGTFGTLGLRGFADGGFNTRNIENSSMTAYDMANMVVSAVQNVQIVTKVTDINREQRRTVTNRVRAEI